MKILEQKDEWQLCEDPSWSKVYATSSGYFRNTITGKNCGQRVVVYEGEEDCYELVLEEENDNSGI